MRRHSSDLSIMYSRCVIPGFLLNTILMEIISKVFHFPLPADVVVPFLFRAAVKFIPTSSDNAKLAICRALCTFSTLAFQAFKAPKPIFADSQRPPCNRSNMNCLEAYDPLG